MLSWPIGPTCNALTIDENTNHNRNRLPFPTLPDVLVANTSAFQCISGEEVEQKEGQASRPRQQAERGAAAAAEHQEQQQQQRSTGSREEKPQKSLEEKHN